MRYNTNVFTLFRSILIKIIVTDSDHDYFWFLNHFRVVTSSLYVHSTPVSVVYPVVWPPTCVAAPPGAWAARKLGTVLTI